MNWGKGIVLAFVAFAIFMGTLVAICAKENTSLVSKDYYAEELNFQQEIEEIRNVSTLPTKPGIAVIQKQLKLQDFPEAMHAQLKVLRPSDSRFDATFDIDSARVVDMSEYPSGRYNASIRWSANGKNYMLREAINL